MHHYSPPVLKVGPYLHSLGQATNSRVPGSQRPQQRDSGSGDSPLQVSVVVTEGQVGVSSQRATNHLELQHLGAGLVPGLEGGVAVEAIGVVLVRVGGVRLQPEVFRTAVIVHDVDHVVLVSGGDVVGFTNDWNNQC